MTPLLNRVAARYPDLPRDAALQRIGRQNAEHYLTHEPLDFAAMVAGKMWHMWHGSGAAGRSAYGTVFQFTVLALALAGLAVLTRRRRWGVRQRGALLRGGGVAGALLGGGRRRTAPLMPLFWAPPSVALAWAGKGFWRRFPSRYLAPPCES